jgi:hypothetical protein
MVVMVLAVVPVLEAVVMAVVRMVLVGKAVADTVAVVVALELVENKR